MRSEKEKEEMLQVLNACNKLLNGKEATVFDIAKEVILEGSFDYTKWDDCLTTAFTIEENTMGWLRGNTSHKTLLLSLLINNPK